MPPKLIDPREALKQAREQEEMPSAMEAVLRPMSSPKADLRPNKEFLKETTSGTPFKTLEQRAKEDFRVFLTLVWRELLHCDPNPIQLDMAWWLQNGPDRAIIMAFRGFAKSWITGSYALWRLYKDSSEQVLVISGSLNRAKATTSWCLQLIMTMDMLSHMRPKPHMRQSTQMFDIGNCTPQQSASFMAAGVGGQIVGFRATCIIPDDVETQTNSLTVVGREKVRDAVKEFESILLPGGVIKYLGTPHDMESLYSHLLSLRDDEGQQVYEARIWPALFPDEKQRKAYGRWLAPYITHHIQKHGPSVLGHSTMPQRFTDRDLSLRKAAMGSTEFLLQFMLDLSGLNKGSYPLRLENLIIMDLDDHQGPESVTWGKTQMLRDLPVMGFDGDFYYGPVMVGGHYQKYQKTVGFLDTSGTGDDEAALSIVAGLNGRGFYLHADAWLHGFAPETLTGIAKACVRFHVNELIIEENFGGGMFSSLLLPVLIKEWEEYLKDLPAGAAKDLPTGTRIVDKTSGKQNKEHRILAILEPVTQSHRLVVSRAVVEWDKRSVDKMEGSDTRTRYALFYQYTHLQRVRDCLGHDDRVESLSGAVAEFAEMLGVDPQGQASLSREEREAKEIEDLLREDDEAAGRAGQGREDHRVEAAKVQKR